MRQQDPAPELDRFEECEPVGWGEGERETETERELMDPGQSEEHKPVGVCVCRSDGADRRGE